MTKVDISAQLADAETVDLLFQTILGRPANNPSFLSDVHDTLDIREWIRRLIASDEFELRMRYRLGATARGKDAIPDAVFRVPSLQPASAPARVLVAGSCMTESWKATIEADHPETHVSHRLFNNASELEDMTLDDIRSYAFQIAQIPLRSVIQEADYFTVPATPDGDTQMADLFEVACRRLERNLEALLKYNRAANLPVFVLNFAVPQSNPLGRLMPRYTLGNFCFFVEELNRRLATLVDRQTNVFVVDFDAIASTLGKRYVMDDSVLHLNHGAFLWPNISNRDIHLTPQGSVDEIYGRKTREATLAIFNECRDMFTTISPTNKIKIVVFDLDGTLWRGIPADGGDIDGSLSEGWPLSLVETAAFLKKRGILVAIASKNDPTVVEPIWDYLYGKKFPLSSFVARKITWTDKVESVRDILAETNLLPGNCMFVDDNPIEREKIKRAFPDMYVIDGPICTWRRQLLWGRELQVPFISAESAGRTESIKAMIRREDVRSTVSEEDFLRELEICIELDEIRNASDPDFTRAFELINKTNQFNSTGRRWSDGEMRDLLAAGGSIITAEVSDRYNTYGLTAALLSTGGECRQMVMSCRTFGLRVEYVLLDAYLRAVPGDRTIHFAWTEKNGPCRNFLSALGFVLEQTPGEIVRLPFSAQYSIADALKSNVVVKEKLALS